MFVGLDIWLLRGSASFVGEMERRVRGDVVSCYECRLASGGEKLIQRLMLISYRRFICLARCQNAREYVALDPCPLRMLTRGYFLWTTTMIAKSSCISMVRWQPLRATRDATYGYV